MEPVNDNHSSGSYKMLYVCGLYDIHRYAHVMLEYPEGDVLDVLVCFATWDSCQFF